MMVAADHRIELEHINGARPSNAELEAVRSVAERFLVDSGRIVVVITGNYVETIRTRDTVGRTAARLDDDPMIPGSMGMAFEHADGSNTIVIRHELWRLEGREPLEPSRMRRSTSRTGSAANTYTDWASV
jgi:hypothetical protein